MNLSILASQSSQLVNVPAVMISRSVCDYQSISLSVKQPVSNIEPVSQSNDQYVGIKQVSWLTCQPVNQSISHTISQ